MYLIKLETQEARNGLMIILIMKSEWKTQKYKAAIITRDPNLWKDYKICVTLCLVNL